MIRAGHRGMALVYATSPRGACHNQSDYFMVDGLGHTMEEIGVELFGRFAGAEKAANVARHQDWRSSAMRWCCASSPTSPGRTCATWSVWQRDSISISQR